MKAYWPASALELPNSARVSRRGFLEGALFAAVTLHAGEAVARGSGERETFEQWIAAFRPKAIARGIAPETYDRVMSEARPDATGLNAIRNQPEFTIKLWQYLNRATTDWKINAGREKARQYAALLARIEHDFGVAPSFMLGVWGIESAFGDPVVEKNHMRPVIPSLATLAWAEPRRRSYWQQELINALQIVQRGWSTPAQMVGSWAGAMGHTQWMPEVWLHVGVDYDGDGRISPYGPPDDALASTARYFVERGGYRRGEAWGYEVRVPAGQRTASRSYAQWQQRGVVRANGEAFAQPDAKARLWVPVPGGPGFLIGPNFFAAKSYNPSMTYALALVYLGDRCVGGAPFVQQFPDGEPSPTLAEIVEIQQRLTALGFDTGSTDGRIGAHTTLAVRDYQRRLGIEPADGYAGVKLLGRLRQGS